MLTTSYILSVGYCDSVGVPDTGEPTPTALSHGPSQGAYEKDRGQERRPKSVLLYSEGKQALSKFEGRAGLLGVAHPTF